MTDTSFDIARVVEKASELRAEREDASQEHLSVFQQPVGISADCLSPLMLQRLIRQGATSEELEHFESCPWCPKLVEQLSEVDAVDSADFTSRILAAVEGRTLADSALEATPSMFRVILGLKDRVLLADLGKMAFTVDMIPAFPSRYLTVLDPSSLEMKGAILSEAVSIKSGVDTNSDGTTDILQLRVEGELAARVREAMTAHRSVIDTVSIKGSFTQPGLPSFVGTASIEFVPPFA